MVANGCATKPPATTIGTHGFSVLLQNCGATHMMVRVFTKPTTSQCLWQRQKYEQWQVLLVGLAPSPLATLCFGPEELGTVQTPQHWHVFASYLRLPFFPTVDMSDPPPGKQSKKSRLLRPIKGLFSRLHSRSPSGTQSVTPHNETASISATNIVTSAPQTSYQGAQSVTPRNATASISTSAANNATSAPQASYRAQSVTPITKKFP